MTTDDRDHDVPVFETRGITRTFRRSGTRGRVLTTALDGVDLTVRTGQRLGIVGESGSGKSTLIRVLDALLPPSSGEVLFRGRRIDNASAGQLGDLRSSVQMVFQDPRSSLDPRMKVGDIVTEPLRSRLLRRRPDVPRDHRERLAEVLEQVELEADAASHYPHEFSGGERQRIAIARAIAPRPDVLIADEAVSALDVSVRAHVLNLFAALVRGGGLTLIFVSHDLAVVRHVCDHVAVMRSGQIVESGPIEQVYTSPAQEYTRNLLASVPKLRARATPLQPATAAMPGEMRSGPAGPPA
ncbi:ABC transporter ATP-binding protein [Propionibacterium australiense]|uniref:ABC transporter n=1 Tax=Propionibacterium australiense TaxID=119981 RepID=A0A383S326_9ACTN|nr:ATP-binding cassette domain-containing protein [Propionibacterium australiense]RLP11671.1 ATP-binding cassette domain-containing protein [Propionibacterium australiense]RLP12184.1 ATP-binding cassette domain-containing protein [Propionibacterium australiense]SYZ32405.1 ABC transporter [Propionibacterium australiense]VEH90280.1 Glutathione import ATP-binding protein GsiA [Propionibacterium australiense]